MAGNQRLSIAEETKIVALLARGDTYQQIQAAFEGLRKLNEKTIRKVKIRNKENLDLIKERQLQREEADALAIKQKANKLISRRLDQSDHDAEALVKANEDFAKGTINYKEWQTLVAKLKPTSLPELVSVSREMHNQSSTETPPQTPHKDLQALVAAIRSGDEVRLSEMVFKGKSDDLSPAPQGLPQRDAAPSVD
jgi:superfamily II RNA helicase